MKCSKCSGAGYIYNNLVGYAEDCSVCHGKGEVQTNEEWFCSLPTEEKAKWLYDHYVNARAEEFYGRPEKTLYDYQKWLVDAHKGIDGTKID